MSVLDQQTQRHGGPYDRGSADAHYGRPPEPHYYVGNTYLSPKITKDNMTIQEIEAYYQGYKDTDEAGDFKSYY